MFSFRSFSLFLVCLAALIVSAPIAGAAKPVKPTLKSATPAAGSISVSGSVKLPAKSAKAVKGKKLKVTVTATGAGPKATKSAKVKAKKKASTIKFKVKLTTALTGDVKIVAQVYAGKKKLGKKSKTRRTTIAGPIKTDPTLDYPGIAIGAGGGFTCAAINDAFKCWGGESNGELGNGAAGDTEEPYIMLGGITGSAFNFSIGATGGCHSLGGPLKCWGRNANYQVGDGTNTQANTPVSVVGLPGDPSYYSRGDQHACATVSFEVYCWGNNSWGQVGSGSTGGDYSTPNKVSTGGYAKQFNGGIPYAVSAGGLNSCANTSNGIWCWGNNSQGQLGAGIDPGVQNKSNVPVHVAGPIAGVGDITRASINVGGSHVCATLGWRMYCWGDNWAGQLGNGSIGGYSTIPATPIVLPIDAVAHISTGVQGSTCAVASGAAYCWGYNASGQLGNGSTGTNTGTPTPVTGLSTHVGSISSGWNHVCASRTLLVYCWGDGVGARISTNNFADSPVPIVKNGL